MFIEQHFAKFQKFENISMKNYETIEFDIVTFIEQYFVEFSKFENISMKNYEAIEYDIVTFIEQYFVEFQKFENIAMKNYETIEHDIVTFIIIINIFTHNKIDEKIRSQNFNVCESKKTFVKIDEFKYTSIKIFSTIKIDKFEFILMINIFELKTTIIFLNHKIDEKTRSHNFNSFKSKKSFIEIIDHSKQKKSSIVFNISMNDATIEFAQFFCCVNCAKYYNFFFDFVCDKKLDSKKSCLLCTMIRQSFYVTIKFCYESYFNDLQKIAQTYFVVSISKNHKTFENQQKKFDKKLKNWRKFSKKVVNFVNQQTLKTFYIHRIFTQQFFVIVDFNMFRKLFHKRVININFDHYLWNLNFNKNRNLKIAATQMIDRKYKHSCEYCKTKKNSFQKCVKMNRQNDVIILSDNCINCVHEKQRCSFEKKSNEK